MPDIPRILAAAVAFGLFVSPWLPAEPSGAAAPLPAQGPIPQAGDGSAAGLIARAAAQLAQPDLPGAIATLQQAVGIAPDSSLVRTRLGGAYLLDQQYDAAVVQFQRALALDTDNANAFIGMAVAYLHSGRLTLSRAALVEARRIDPTKATRIDEVLAWIDQRTEVPAP